MSLAASAFATARRRSGTPFAGRALCLRTLALFVRARRCGSGPRLQALLHRIETARELTGNEKLNIPFLDRYGGVICIAAILLLNLTQWLLGSLRASASLAATQRA